VHIAIGTCVGNIRQRVLPLVLLLIRVKCLCKQNDMSCALVKHPQLTQTWTSQSHKYKYTRMLHTINHVADSCISAYTLIRTVQLMYSNIH